MCYSSSTRCFLPRLQSLAYKSKSPSLHRDADFTIYLSLHKTFFFLVNILSTFKRFHTSLFDAVSSNGIGSHWTISVNLQTKQLMKPDSSVSVIFSRRIFIFIIYYRHTVFVLKHIFCTQKPSSTYNLMRFNSCCAMRIIKKKKYGAVYPTCA